ncbi:hypothetical protein NHX12_032835 [Muraenolepis orangiensis]|uniref:Uncharacterized protein n=1 Tax=Muraenolepis orangiensis TaxID=630683 RepID=A0A9Q0IFT0_9TELE|nr:hypothetical protein NHX12_032835 [Muraenolepis orangiensis]
MMERSQTDQLCSASANGHLAEVKRFLQNGAHVNGRNEFGRTALQVVKLGCPTVAKCLLDAGADPDRRDPVYSLTVVHDAAREGFVDMVRVLVNHEADVNLVDERGNLPLHLAAGEGHTEVVQLLAERTAEPGRRNAEGRNAYDLALGGGKAATAEWIDYFRNLK